MEGAAAGRVALPPPLADLGETGAVLCWPGAPPRSVRRRVKRLPRVPGWISLNDGPAFASEVARYLQASGYG
jgi:hypothetical protein